MVPFAEVVFTDSIGFPPSCTLLVVTCLTTTRVQCAYPLQEEAFIHRDEHSLIGEKERSSRLSLKVYSDEIVYGEYLLKGLLKELKVTSAHDSCE
jgi:hypothetical protein